ncbi:site-specific DNA-methyltransferase [Lewinella lacunae]|uniref:site-specific DNA-methyltransferase (adenine-specific) n=1 Tax=Neolewinella lacunae TaxID=1517758 RepID=A0A923PKN8_9BACT|nr:site-specific DNA-methyltransferase [Neolewinella lacunae]
MAKKKTPTTHKEIAAHTHEEAKRTNIPSAEMQPIVDEDTRRPIKVAYERRNRDLDPQLIWRGKYPKNQETGLEDMDLEQDLTVNAPPLYIQERVNPKVLIDDLVARTKARQTKQEEPAQLDLFGDFDGVPEGDAKTEFYQHEANWSNRMILGDSLQVMASLAEREGLRGKVQCIYFDPPYGIKFNSNFQWSTNSRTVRDGNSLDITREAEQVKAFRDTWRDGIHSYLNYLRDRLLMFHELLNDSGSVFFQIGEENLHLISSLMSEVFGQDNHCANIVFVKTNASTSDLLSSVNDYIVWYAKDKNIVKYRPPLIIKEPGEEGATAYTKLLLSNGETRRMTKSELLNPKNIPDGAKIFATGDMTSQRPPGDFPVKFEGQTYRPVRGYWKTGLVGFPRLIKSGRINSTSGGRLSYVRYLMDFPAVGMSNVWTDTLGQNQFGGSKTYVVQTALKAIQRCLLMTTDPGDLVLDPTCGSGSTATVAEEFGRRWITIDTSRVALTLARVRLMGARYPYFLLTDSNEGQLKLAEITRTLPSDTTTNDNINSGFVYERVPHITLKSIANNTEIDTIYDSFQEKLEPLRSELNQLLGTQWEEWEIPRSLDASTAPASAPSPTIPKGEEVRAEKLLAQWWKYRIARQKEIDASIAAKADVEYLYDKPYEDKSKVRVAGPFTVESISPHRMLGVDEQGNPFDQLEAEDPATHAEAHDFVELILNNLRKSGVQQDKKADKISFDSLEVFPGRYIVAEGIYREEDGTRRRAAIHIGPEFGSIGRPDLVEAAREAADLGMDVVIACGFNYDAQSTEFSRLGRIPVLKARMNADLHMAQDLAATGAGNLFVIFGEPDIEVFPAVPDVSSGKSPDGTSGTDIQVRVLGVDIFDPRTGKVRSDDVDGIACWFIDTNYNGEAFFVRHAYFLGANDPYQSLKTTLKAEVDREAWETLNSDTSRPFPKPETGRIAIKIINHLGDEVMKVVRVG